MALDVRSQACSYLRNGKVTVRAALPGSDRLPVQVEAVVQGNSGTYLVDLIDQRWRCSCGKAELCAHAAAVQLVTGHDGLARMSGESR